MDLFKKKTQRYVPEITRASNLDEEKRVQFNIFVKPMTKWAMRYLAAEYGVPIYCVVEHACQIGGFYMMEAKNDPKEKERLSQHLISKHLLGKPDAREMDFLACSRPVFSSLLLRDIVSLYEEYKRLDYLAFKANDLPDAKWRAHTTTTRQNMRVMFSRLIVKIDRLCAKDEEAQHGSSGSHSGWSGKDAIVDEDYTHESEGDEETQNTKGPSIR